MPEKILAAIKAHKRIIISRHTRPDGDAVGGSLGLKALLKSSFPEKEVYVINSDYSKAMAFLGQEDAQLPDEAYTDALLIVLDTGDEGRISNKKYRLASALAVIDHHIERNPYGDIAWVEPERSSLCEMIVAFYTRFSKELVLTKEAAACLYTGMVTDSGRFRYEGVNGDTLRLAGLLLDQGIDTEHLFGELYLNEYWELKFHAHIINRMKLTPQGVAYVHITPAIVKRFRLSKEQASNAISYIGSLKNSLIWLAFIDNEDGTVRVRLRSRYVPVNKLAEKYQGGGHAFASGATLVNSRQIRRLLKDADELLLSHKKGL